MTFDEFKEDFMTFLITSTVNLGRKTTKTKRDFLEKAASKFNVFVDSRVNPREVFKTEEEKKSSANPMDGSVICIKPTDRNKALDVGKGVHSMTPSESLRADEQLGRSPYGANSSKEE